jgi:hypothetical protein
MPDGMKSPMLLRNLELRVHIMTDDTSFSLKLCINIIILSKFVHEKTIIIVEVNLLLFPFSF